LKFLAPLTLLGRIHAYWSGSCNTALATSICIDIAYLSYNQQ
jgi:hypothetical protein